MKKFFWVTCGLVIATALGASVSMSHSHQEPQDDIALRDLMRSKLMYSQNIVEGLSLGRFDLISAAADEIDRIAGAQQWLPQDDPQLSKIRSEMRDVAVRLRKSADKKNLEASAVRYFELTMKCIDCHQALRKTDF